MEQIFLTCKEVCRRHNVSKATLYRMLGDDNFPPSVPYGKRGRRWHIEDLVAYEKFLARVAKRNKS